MGDGRVLLAAMPLGLLGVATATALATALRRSPRFPGTACGLLLLILPYLPASHLLVTVGFTVAERTLYLPSAGMALLLAALAIPPRERFMIPAQQPGPPQPSGGVLGKRSGARVHAVRRAWVLLLFVMHGVLCMRRNLDWRTNESLLRSGVRCEWGLPWNL